MILLCQHQKACLRLEKPGRIGIECPHMIYDINFNLPLFEKNLEITASNLYSISIFVMGHFIIVNAQQNVKCAFLEYLSFSKTI
jgi:hypothetical protein